MKTTLNKKIRKIIENGNYLSSEYYETRDMTQKRMSETDYSYYVTTADNIIHFYTKNKTIELPLKDFEWRILWDKLGNIPINDNAEIEEPFEHFEIGTENTDIWHWFEWFFNITLGKELFA